jgi:hypothetical protein
MGTELKTIGAADLPAVVAILNQSSADYSFQFHLDLVGYLNLSRFWNFSYEFSYLAWAGPQPAGVLLNCVDAATGEAYTFYWGVLPEFQKRRLSIELARAYLAEMKHRGFSRTYATSSVDSPLSIYNKLGYRLHHSVIELRANVIPAGPSSEIVKLDVTALLRELPLFPVALRPWVRRPGFLQSAAPFLEIIGARQGERLDAWMALTRWTGETSIVAFDFQPDAEDAAQCLISHLATYPAPFSATHIVNGSRAEALLRGRGFVSATERVSIVLDLAAYSPKR